MTDLYRQFREAWESPDRRGALNLTVERLAPDAALTDLDAALRRLLLEVRAAGADEDTEEVINEVSDRLHGWVHPASRIACRVAESSKATSSNSDSSGVTTTRERIERLKGGLPAAPKSIPLPSDVPSIIKQVARIRKQLSRIAPILPAAPSTSCEHPEVSAPHVAGSLTGTTCRIVFPTGERRGVKLLAGRAVRQSVKGVYVIPSSDLTVLAGANIPFAFIGYEAHG